MGDIYVLVNYKVYGRHCNPFSSWLMTHRLLGIHCTLAVLDACCNMPAVAEVLTTERIPGVSWVRDSGEKIAESTRHCGARRVSP